MKTNLLNTPCKYKLQSIKITNDSIPLQNKNQDHEFFTAEAVMRLFILAVIFTAISIAGFVASYARCTVWQGNTWVNTCAFETRASIAIGGAAAFAGAVFTLSGCIGLHKRGAFDER
ncbi:uncharacterized protein LOC134770943 [Penaeus indicus]|uniref:uncharacterized protein LOC134770943 n=1 Tax=Penaeus indicus TaxID=29960 RepID=UPI00300CAC50